jgi:hypothetical protein
MRKFNGWSILFFFILWAIAGVTGWVNSPAFISHVSMVALILGSLSAWQAARVEVRQEEELKSNETTSPERQS